MWSIAGPAWIIPGPKQWPEVEYGYVFPSRGLAERWIAFIRSEFGDCSLSAVPLPRRLSPEESAQCAMFGGTT